MTWRAATLLRPLRGRRVALLWAGLATSAVGDQLFLVALSWVAVRVLGTAAGYLTALQPATILAVALLAGGAADRVAPMRLMVASDLVRALVLGGLVLAWLVAGAPPAWGLVAAVLVLAAGHALFRPALQAVIPPLVDDVAMLPAANALFEMTDRVARLLGPGLISLLGAVLPVVHFVTIDVATFIASAASVLAIGRPQHAGEAWRPDGPRQPVGRTGGVMANLRVARGLHAMAGHPALRFYLLVSAAPVSGLWWAIMFLGVPLATRLPGGDGLAGFGLVVSCYGATNLIANLVIGAAGMPRRPGWLIFGGDVVLGAGMALIGLAAWLPPPPWRLAGLCVGAAVGAVGGPMTDIPVAVLRQTRLRLSDQAAAMRAVLIAFNLGTLICFAGAPVVFDAIGPGASIIAGGAVMMAIGLLGLLRHANTPA